MIIKPIVTLTFFIKAVYSQCVKVYLDNLYSILNYIKSVSGLEWPWFMADNSKFVLFANVFHLMDNLIFDKVKIALKIFL